MNDHMAANRFALAGVFGIVLMILFAFALLAASIWKRVWNWIDEGERPIKRNQIAEWLYKRAGYEPTGEYSNYKFKNKKGNLTDGEPALMIPLLALLLGPTAVLTLFVLYELTLAVLVCYVVAHTARFARRTSKALNKHAADPHAHKEAK